MKRLLEFRPTYSGPILTFDLDRIVSTAVLALSALTIAALLLIAPPAMSAPKDFPRPAALEKDVAFWKRIYSEVGTDAGLIHDSRDLGIVYEVAKIPTGASRRARERHTEKRKKHFKQILLRLAKGKRSGLSNEEKRVLALFPDDVSNGTLRKSASRVRFQLGQANKFRAGVIRSGAYRPHILSTLRDMNLPLEIANLPHVESSYTPNVYSRVGAAGLWQFTRSTGRRFMQVDHVVDERLDPYRASIAAARLLEQNRRVTGSWPLAITAYNHGAAGMRRAARKLGTKDITTIVRKYKSRTFGFASRNFYVEFLAASAVASNPEFYFGPLVLDRPIAYDSVDLPYYAKASDLANAIGVDRRTLEQANPALRPTVWKGAKRIPKGFSIKVPRAALPKPLAQGIASLPVGQQYARQTRDTTYTVRRGDTLSTIARRHGVRMSELVALNGLRSKHRIRIGQKIKLPTDGSPSRAPTRTASYTPSKKSADAPAALPENGFYTVRRGDNLSKIASNFGITVADLVALNDLRSRNRIHAGQQLRVSRGGIIAVGETGTYTVRRGDNLTEIARRHGIGVGDLVALNDLRSRNRIHPGQKLRVPAQPLVASARPQQQAHPDAAAALSPARTAELAPEATDFAATDDPAPESDVPAADESPTEPSPGLLADPTDYTVASNGTILVQTGETLGHFAEWLGLRASRLREINGLRFGEPVVVQQRLRLDFSDVAPEAFERIRVEYHRSLQEDFFAEWEIEGTVTHRVGRGDSLWILSTRRYDVPIWLLRQYNPDVDLDALSKGMKLTIPKLRQRNSDSASAVASAPGRG
ncbi:MAG: LysM peptidoglycan-binding domain-containing protein [Myxococcota bacterium]